jgi:hypothetical protein
MAAKLSPQQQALLDILGTNGGWMGQDEIAHRMGEDVLKPEDAMQLDLLGDAGLLIKETSDNLGTDGQGIRYRISEPKAEIKSHGTGR